MLLISSMMTTVLADAGTAERANLATLQKTGQIQINGPWMPVVNTCGLGGLIHKARGAAR